MWGNRYWLTSVKFIQIGVARVITSNNIALLCCTTVCVGYILTTFVDAVEVSKCYAVNSENYCFYTSGSVFSWNEAREFCAERNSTLPIITDEDIDSVFQQFIVNDAYSVIQNTSVWINAHARPVNNSVSWHWIDGRPSGTDTDSLI